MTKAWRILTYGKRIKSTPESEGVDIIEYRGHKYAIDKIDCAIRDLGNQESLVCSEGEGA